MRFSGRRSEHREHGRLRRLAAPLRRPHYRRLWLSQVLSEIGDWAARLALSVLVYDRTGSAALGSVAFIAGLLPALGVGQWLSTYADRHGRRVVMVGCDLLRAALFGLLALPVAWPAAVALSWAVLAGVATLPFESARAAAVIDVCEEGPPDGIRQRVVAAVTLGQVTQELATMLGYLAGGALLVGWGPGGGLAVDAFTFVVSAALLVGLPPMVPPPNPDGPPVGAWPRLRAAAAALTADPLLRRVALLASFSVATGTAVLSLVVPFVALALPGQGWLSGAALAGAAGAALIVTVGLPSGLAGPRTQRWTASLCLLPVLLDEVLTAAGSPLIALAGFVCAGILFTPLVPAVGLVAPRLPGHLRATCFGLLTAVLTVMQATLCLAAGLLCDALGPGRAVAVVLAPIGFAGTALLLRSGFAVGAGQGRRRAPAPPSAAPSAMAGPRTVEPAEGVVWAPAVRHRLRAAVHTRVGVPLAVTRPAPALYRLNGPALVVNGRQVRPGAGAVLGVALWVELRPTLRQVVSHLLDPQAAVHLRSTLTGGVRVDSFEAAGSQDAARSLDAAVAVAAQVLGEPVTVSGAGCRVDQVIDLGTAEPVLDLTGDLGDVGGLLPGDVIVRTTDGRTDTTAALHRLLPPHGGTTLGVRRPGVSGVLDVPREPGKNGGWGFSASTHRQGVECALDVSLDLPDGTYGPSLGLGVTLALIDLLGDGRPQGITGGLHVAVTGSVLPDGRVVAVGGVVQKARAVACHPPVAAFLVPAGNADELAVVRRILPGRTVQPVATVTEALAALDALAANPSRP